MMEKYKYEINLHCTMAPWKLVLLHIKTKRLGLFPEVKALALLDAHFFFFFLFFSLLVAHFNSTGKSDELLL